LRVKFLVAGLALAPVVCLAQSVTAESAIAIDAASGKILYQKNENEELYPASTTKIMTALLLLEHRTLDEVIVAPADVTKVRESTMHLKPFEKVPVKDMLYALMLRSANDGCYAVAVNLAGSVEKFSDLMNARAKELGCTHTHFDNPNGLNDRLHYTTAHDLALIAKEAMRYQEFRDIVRTERQTINRSTDWQDTVMVNHNKILRRDPSCDGIKTGWTIPAGHCFVGTASREGWRVITVVLKSKSWEDDTETLFNWAFAKFVKHEEVKEGETVAVAPVGGAQVPMIASDDAYTLTPREIQPSSDRKIQLVSGLTAPVTRNEKLGDLFIRDTDGFEQDVPLVSNVGEPPAASGAVASAPAKRGGNGPNLWIWAGLLGGAIYIRGKSRRRLMRVATRAKAR